MSNSAAMSPRRRSASTSSTRAPALDMVMARLLVIVDLPSFGIADVTMSVFNSLWFGMKISDERRLRNASANMYRVSSSWRSANPASVRVSATSGI